jgi:hypothetical protein
MAGSTLLQCLNDGSDFGPSTTNRRQTEIFLASATVVVGDAVSLDFSKTEDSDKALYVKQTKIDEATQDCCIGVVLRSVETDGALTAGSRIEVVTRGIVRTKVHTDTNAAGHVMIGTGTVGQLGPNGAAASQYPTVGVSAAAQADGYAMVYIFNNF